MAPRPKSRLVLDPNNVFNAKITRIAAVGNDPATLRAQVRRGSRGSVKRATLQSIADEVMSIAVELATAEPAQRSYGGRSDAAEAGSYNRRRKTGGLTSRGKSNFSRAQYPFLIRRKGVPRYWRSFTSSVQRRGNEWSAVVKNAHPYASDVEFGLGLGPGERRPLLSKGRGRLRSYYRIPLKQSAYREILARDLAKRRTKPYASQRVDYRKAQDRNRYLHGPKGRLTLGHDLRKVRNSKGQLRDAQKRFLRVPGKRRTLRGETRMVRRSFVSNKDASGNITEPALFVRTFVVYGPYQIMERAIDIVTVLHKR